MQYFWENDVIYSNFPPRIGTRKINCGAKFSEMKFQKTRVVMVVIDWYLSRNPGKTYWVRKCKKNGFPKFDHRRTLREILIVVRQCLPVKKVTKIYKKPLGFRNVYTPCIVQSGCYLIFRRRPSFLSVVNSQQISTKIYVVIFRAEMLQQFSRTPKAYDIMCVSLTKRNFTLRRGNRRGVLITQPTKSKHKSGQIGLIQYV